MLLQIPVARFTMREWEREREEWEKIWHNRLALRIYDEMTRRGFLLQMRKRRDPTWMSIWKVYTRILFFTQNQSL